MRRTLKRFKPTGYTPLGAALRESRAAFEGKEDVINRIILVTDGIETCGGNPVEEARKLKQAGIKVTTDIVGFDVANPAEARRRERSPRHPAASTATPHRRRPRRLLRPGAQARRGPDQAVPLVLAAADEVKLCQMRTVTRGSLYMHRSSTHASRAGRDAEADEIDRLNKEITAAADERDEAFDRRSDAAADRVRRELAEAERRVKRLADRGRSQVGLGPLDRA